MGGAYIYKKWVESLVSRRGYILSPPLPHDALMTASTLIWKRGGARGGGGKKMETSDQTRTVQRLD